MSEPKGITPPNSRLFIISSKSFTEDDFREAFEEFGEIEDIRIVRDRQTSENKGITYIKYAKTSQAAKALEAMNGKCLGKAGRSIKVMIAASKDQGAKRDDKESEDERTTRLFVKIPKSWNKSDLFDAFKSYGNIDYANVVKDKNTNENKGFGFVKFMKFSDAAVAYEECDRDFKAVFAEPKKNSKSLSTNRSGEGYSSSENYAGYSSPFRNIIRSESPSYMPLSDSSREVYTRLQVTCSSMLTQMELWRLFDIVPELDSCDIKQGGPRSNRSIATVVYNHPKWAAYALQKLHGFEYPPGMPLMIKPDFESRSPRNIFPRHSGEDWDSRSSKSNCDNTLAGCSSTPKTDLEKLAQTLAQASSLLQAAGLSPELLKPKNTTNISSICNVKLPDPRPLENIDAVVVARCFIVCSPNPPPVNILRDIFCRFGNLIDVYLLNGKNCGYAKYTSKESAEKAIRVLHGAEICGCRVKVMEAMDQPEHKRKRARLDEQE